MNILMSCYLTNDQKQTARFLVEKIREEELPESFMVHDQRFASIFDLAGRPRNWQEQKRMTGGHFDALEKYELLIVTKRDGSIRHCTVTGLLYKMVDSNFAEEPLLLPTSTSTHPNPPEISMSLDRLRSRYPDPKKLGFLIMRFAAEKPYARIVNAIKETADKHGLVVIRADEHQFHNSLLNNVRTFLHGCGFGIAIYERIKTEEPNANVGLEVGYLMAMNKPVLLLKDKTAEKLQTDLAGELYREFDPHDPEGTIPEQLTKWLKDFGIVVD
jgi:hypothetical protein